MNCPKCGNELKPNMKFCAKCGTAVAPAGATQPKEIVSSQPIQQKKPSVQAATPVQAIPTTQQNNVPDKKKKDKTTGKKKNLGLKITAIILAIAVFLTGGIFIFDRISYKNSLKGAEYIKDFPVLKQKTELTVYDSEKFPAEEYNIKVERMGAGGILKSGKIFKSETIVDEDSTSPTFNIDFEKDGNYIITLTDITSSRTQTTKPSETTETLTQEDATKPEKSEKKKKDDDEQKVIIIEVEVDDEDENAAEKVDLNSNTGENVVKKPKTPLEEVVGTYKGSYFAPQGETGLTLTVYEEEGQYRAIFDFYSLPGKSNSKSGKYYMNVTYDEETQIYYFAADEWIEAPFMYGLTDLAGKLNGDVLSGESPIKFSVTRGEATSGDEDKKVQEEPEEIKDMYNENAEMYNNYLINGGLNDAYENTMISEENDATISSCLVDINEDGIYELVLQVRDNSWNSTADLLYSIQDGEVVLLAKDGLSGGTAGGAVFAVKYDTVEEKHTVILDGHGRDGAWLWYGWVNLIEYDGKAFSMNNQYQSHGYLAGTDVYDAEIERIKEETDLYYIDEDDRMYVYLFNDQYISEDEYKASVSERYTDPTDSKFQMKQGSASNPLGL